MRIPRNAHDPIPTGLNRASIFEIASGAAQKWGYKPGELSATILERLGGKIGSMNGMTNVILGSLPSANSDCLIAYGDRDYLAMVQSPHQVDQPRTNLDLAIILGYLAMHFSNVRKKHGSNAAMIVRHYPSTKDDEACHREAIQFAIGLLAPPERLLAEWERHDGDIRKLRDIFCLPGDFLKSLHDDFSTNPKKAA